ncbi:MAG: hypothetical protein ACTTG8_07755 [Catonella sp.]|uniref:hypothetical protein n=1 Tax=Catonella sp. TaxID=2382125 RepID=UPI003F9EF481
MGKTIVCSGKIAENPYIVADTQKKLYSIEEICYYVKTSIYSIDLGFFCPELIRFIKEDLGLAKTATKLKTLVMGNYFLSDVITTLFCGCDLYSKEEILETVEMVKYLSNMPVWERQAYIGYKKFEERKFLAAIKYFRATLREENIANKDYGEILESIGICLIHVSSFKEAAEYFHKAYKYTQKTETLTLALLALKLGSQDKEFHENAKEFTEDESLIANAEKMWKETEKMAMVGLSAKNIDNMFEKLKTNKVAEGYKEIEMKLKEFKAEYREGAWDGPVS